MQKNCDTHRVVRPACPCKECKATAKRISRRDARMNCRDAARTWKA